MTTYIAVVGPADSATEQDLQEAREAGRLLARAGCVVLTGGLGGVMAAAVDGAVAEGGLTLGLLPDRDRSRAHGSLTLSVPTGMGEMRNALLVRSSDAVLAVGGSWGTLSEIAHAVRSGVPVVQVGGWDLREYGDVPDLGTAAAGVAALLDRLRA
jgi:uncharacterized protein (TIGR00725 family)